MEYDKLCEDGRPAGAGGAGDATAPTDFGKSFNPISARIFRPFYSPGYLVLPKIPQIPQNLFGRSAQIGQTFGILLRKALIGRL